MYNSINFSFWGANVKIHNILWFWKVQLITELKKEGKHYNRGNVNNNEVKNTTREKSEQHSGHEIERGACHA